MARPPCRRCACSASRPTWGPLPCEITSSVLLGEGRERRAATCTLRRLRVRRHRLAPLQEGVATEGDEDPHRSPQLPSVATSSALIVCRRFSAWSNTMLAERLEDLVGDLEAVGHAGALHDLPPDGGVRVVVRGQAVHELGARVPGRFAAGRRSPGTAASSADPLVPHVLRLAHRHPDVGVHEVDALHGRASASSVIVIWAPVRPAMLLRRRRPRRRAAAGSRARPGGRRCPSARPSRAASGPCCSGSRRRRRRSSAS